VNLTSRYLGLQLPTPVVASAGPLCGDLDTIRHLEDAGAGAVVLPSIFEEQIEAEMLRYETLRTARAESFPEALSYFPSQGFEARGLQRHLDLVRRAVLAVDIPVIASLNGTTDDGWVSYAREVEKAGAHAVELNAFMVPTDLSVSGQAVEQRYLDILRAVRRAVTIPVAVKLGPSFSAPGHMAVELARNGAGALVLFNRFYQPDIDTVRLTLRNDLELSRTSEVRLPLLWIAVLAGRIDASLAASTGVETSEEVVKYLLAGADIVMTTSALLRHGAGYVAELVGGLRDWLAARDVPSVDRIRGLLSHRRLDAPETLERANYMEILESYTSGPTR
jgi:dihydroorotate dehydrogenase (fumarate)